MTKPAKTPKPSRAQLESKIAALEAQLLSTVINAASEITALAKKDYTASAMIVTIKGLDGRELLKPVGINDGLSKETLAALHADIIRTYGLKTAYPPAALKA